MPQWFPIFPNAINNNTHTTQPHPFMTSSLIKVLIGQYFSTLASLINLHCTSCMCCCCCICCIFFVDTFLFWEDTFGFGTPWMISFHFCFFPTIFFSSKDTKSEKRWRFFLWDRFYCAWNGFYMEIRGRIEFFTCWLCMGENVINCVGGKISGSFGLKQAGFLRFSSGSWKHF